MPFTDVAGTDWFYNAVKAVYDEGIMNGVSDTEFAPNMPLTRGMLVTIVGRMGAAESASNTSFADVSADAYYAPYVAWAAENIFYCFISRALSGSFFIYSFVRNCAANTTVISAMG